MQQKLHVKGMYNEVPTNMSERRVARLDAAQIDAVKCVFNPRWAVLEHFGYPILELR